MREKKIIVIGAGLSGLANAAMLAKNGFDVTVVEQQPMPGGVARCIKDRGFHFDMGPSWYLMPEIFETYFAYFGKKPSDYYKLVELDPSYKIYFENDRTVSISKDMEANKQLFDTLEENGGEKLARYLDESKQKYEIAVNKVLYKNFFSVFDFLRTEILRYGLKLNMFTNLDKYAKKFLKDHRSRKIVEFNTVFLGSSPYSVPALYSLMSYVDLQLGVYYPEGGIFELPKALFRLAKEQGVRFKFGTKVKKILFEKRRAVGVRTNTGDIQADIVLSSADYHFTDTELLDLKHRNYSRTYWNTRVMGPSSFLLYLGLNKKIPDIVHHTFYLADNWREHFDTIFHGKKWPENPCYYLCCPSKTDPAAAPEGKETLFVLVPLAPGLDDTDTVRKSFTDKILRHIEGVTGTSIRDSIEVMYTYSHRDFSGTGNLYQGTALGLAHTLPQTAFLRPSHKSRRAKNLYFAGSYTQPGIGMPMVLIGAHLVSGLITKEQL
jgi:phytoene desaturase